MVLFDVHPIRIWGFIGFCPYPTLFCILKDNVLVTPPVSKYCVRAGGEPNSSFDLETVQKSQSGSMDVVPQNAEPCNQMSIRAFLYHAMGVDKSVCTYMRFG